MPSDSIAKPKLVFMGTPAFAAKALAAILQADIADVVAVYSQPPRPANRGKKLTKSDVHQLAEDHGLPVFHPLNFKNDDDVTQFKTLDADLAVVAAYGLILPASILDAPKFGCVNIHASLLPRWRGAAPIHRAIEAGDSKTGVCLMQMDRGLDTGDVISIVETPTTCQHTTPVLHDQLAQIGAQMIVELIQSHPHGGWSRTAQAEEGVTYAKKIDKAEARIDWTQSAEEIERKVRAFVPYPGAYFELPETNERVKVLQAEAMPGGMSLSPGSVIEALNIQCGQDSALKILRAQRAGKSAMPADDILRGLALAPGTVLAGV